MSVYNGLHGLSCLKSAGRLPRHGHLNDIVKRSLTRAGIPSALEPAGSDRGNGKRPDGLTLYPFSRGKSLIWDATCTDTFCPTALNKSACAPGSAADGAEERKEAHYASLSERFRFVPVAIETAGVYGKKTEAFISKLGGRMAAATGDARERAWLRQRLSIAVVRGNAASILATGRWAAG